MLSMTGCKMRQEAIVDRMGDDLSPARLQLGVGSPAGQATPSQPPQCAAPKPAATSAPRTGTAPGGRPTTPVLPLARPAWLPALLRLPSTLTHITLTVRFFGPCQTVCVPDSTEPAPLTIFSASCILYSCQQAEKGKLLRRDWESGEEAFHFRQIWVYDVSRSAHLAHVKAALRRHIFHTSLCPHLRHACERPVFQGGLGLAHCVLRHHQNILKPATMVS